MKGRGVRDREKERDLTSGFRPQMAATPELNQPETRNQKFFNVSHTDAGAQALGLSLLSQTQWQGAWVQSGTASTWISAHKGHRHGRPCCICYATPLPHSPKKSDVFSRFRSWNNCKITFLLLSHTELFSASKLSINTKFLAGNWAKGCIPASTILSKLHWSGMGIVVQVGQTATLSYEQLIQIPDSNFLLMHAPEGNR